MNIKHLQAMVCAITFSVLATSANAASMSVAGPTSAAPGASFSLTLEGDFTDVGLFGGGVLVSWDPALFTLNLVTLDPDAELNPLDAGLSCPGAGFCPADTASESIIGWSPSGANVLGLATATMARLDFTSTGASGTGVFSIADDLAVFGGMADLLGQPIAMIYDPLSVTVNAVPVPAAVWLFGSGVLGLVGVARRRKAA
ncbi:MAG: VPLPA-CTERM sorting domain-containing protein [Gammaproteobacteria bacterium]